jgi:hypothetical protein
VVKSVNQVADYLKKAADHERSAEAMTAPDWKVVVYFYSAVHLVNAALLRDGIRVSNHAERAEELRAHPELKRIYDIYKTLTGTAYSARYECYPSSDFSKDVPEAKAKLERIKQHIGSILT